MHSSESDGIHPVQIHLIGIRDTPDHHSVRNNEFTLWGRDLVRCPYFFFLFLSVFDCLITGVLGFAPEGQEPVKWAPVEV